MLEKKANLPNVLIVINEALSNGVVRSQILYQAYLIQKNNIAHISIIAIALNRNMMIDNKNNLKASQEISSCNIYLMRGFPSGRPFCDKLNSYKLFKFIQNLNLQCDIIHARTDYTASISGHLGNKLECKLLWDCRGDAVSELEYSNVNKLKNLRRYIALKRQKSAARNAHMAIFVSEELKESMSSVYSKDKKSFIIPCTADSNLFFYNAELRSRMRKLYGINDKQKVFIYSGGLASYQLFNETINHFLKVWQFDKEAFLIILCQDETLAKEKIREFHNISDNILIKSVDSKEVNSYLNASDFAYMLRDYSPINKVASPTKFAEYGMAGLNIIMTDSPPSCSRLSNECGNKISPQKNVEDVLQFSNNREKTANFYRQKLSRDNFINKYKEIYSS